MRWLFPLTLLIATISYAQTDTIDYALPAQRSDMIRYEGGFDFREGLFFDFSDFRNNRPSVPKERLLGSQGEPVTDLHATDGRFRYLDSTGAEQRIDMDGVWAFCDRNVVYIWTGRSFDRIGHMGSIAHLMFDASYYDIAPSGYGTSRYTVEEQRLLDMETGQLLPATGAGIRQVIQRDPELLHQFDPLPKRQRNGMEAVFLFMNRYNERHPLYFPR